MRATLVITVLFLVLVVAIPLHAQMTSSFGNSGSSPFVRFGSGTLFSGNTGSGLSSGGMNTGMNQSGSGPGMFGSPNVNTQNAFNSRNMLQNMMGRSGMRNQMFNTMNQGYGGMGGNTPTPRISIKLGSGPSLANSLAPEGPPHQNPTLTKRINFTLTERMQTAAGPNPPLSSVVVLMQGDTAILRGSVPTDHDRDLARRLMLLEPGVDQVKNELTVGSL